MVKKIVIIGCGYAGFEAAKGLEKKLKETEAKITVIEKRSFWFHAVGALRALVDPSYENKLFIPLNQAFKRIELIQAEAQSIEDNEVVIQRIGKTKTMERIPFDYLILATGSTYPSPIKPRDGAETQTEILKEIKMIREKLIEAQSILIIGGGPVGIELAGEIGSAFPQKSITLLDGKKELIANHKLKSKLRNKLMHEIEKMNVTVRLGDRLTTRLEGHGLEHAVLETVSGVQIESDLQFLCGGARQTVNLMETLNSDRGIQVKPNFQVNDPRYQNVFVIGDASDHPTPKMAYWGAEQGKALAKALSRHIKSNNNMPTFATPATEALIVPLGPNGGVSQLPMFGGLVVGNKATKLIKSKDMLAGMFWSAANATVPK